MRRITWLGHATVLLELDGARLLTDPLLRDRVAHLRRHAPPVDPELLSAPLDAVLISHAHHDHLDRPSLRLLADATEQALVAPGCAAFLRGLGFGAVRELQVGETSAVGPGATVEAVHAWHPTRRWPQRTTHDAVGFLVERVWFAGDTDLDPAMHDLRGRVDVALVPIWGWGPALGPGHLDPAAAAEAVAAVAPRVVVPIHWGTLLPVGSGRRYGDLLSAPAEEFAAHVARAAPDVEVAVLSPGEALSI